MGEAWEGSPGRSAKAPRYLRLRGRLRGFPAGLLPWALLAALGGCTTVIVPPASPADPVPVFLLDHGRHASLVLPLEDGGGVRYSYGDWDWYVLDQTGLGSGLRALLQPTTAALGRKLLKGPVTDENVRRQLAVVVLESLEIRAPSENVARLREELGRLFAEAFHTLHYSPTYDVEFVRHPQPYTLHRNSNQMVAHWLEALGCQVRGSPILSNWRLGQ